MSIWSSELVRLIFEQRAAKIRLLRARFPVSHVNNQPVTDNTETGVTSMRCAKCGVKLCPCASDFPEYLGYCNKCYPSSDLYIAKMSLLNALLDRLDKPSMDILCSFIKEYEEDHEGLYMKEIARRIQ